MTAMRALVAFVTFLFPIVCPLPVAAVAIEIDYTDRPGTGFDDPVYGAARRTAFEAAVDIWATALAGNFPVVVDASMPEMGGSGDSALLASSGPTTLQRNFPRAPQLDTFYPAALANQLSGADLNGIDLSEITIVFNAAVDNSSVLGSLGWYYGLDAQPGSDIDFLSIALHELGHGLGFAQFVNSANGTFLQGTPAVFDLQIIRPGVGSFASMRNAERLAAITSGQLFWAGPHVVAAFGAPPPLYAPNPFRSGSSISHWDTSLDELMAPFFVGAVHDPGLLLPALVDMGWRLGVDATPLPSAPPTPTPTATESPVATATPTTPVHPPRRFAYVSNYDDSTLTVIDAEMLAVRTTVPVGAGPLGVAATTDGRLVLTANFQDHTLSLLATAMDAVVDTIALPGAPNAIIVAGNDRRAYVSLTDIDSVAVVDFAARTVITVIRVGRNPSGLAITADGSSVLVAHFNEPTLGLIDTEALVLRAKANGNELARGFTNVTMPSGGGDGYLTAIHSRRFWSVEPIGYRIFSPRVVHPVFDLVPEAIAFAPAGDLAYVAAFRRDNGFGWVVKIDTDTGQARVLEMIAVGEVPQALAIAGDGRQLFVANTGSGTVSVVEPHATRVVATLAVGAAPMGIAVVDVPRLCRGDCDGDGATTVDEIIAGLNIALGIQSPEECPAIDVDLSGEVSVDEIIAAVDASLTGCE